MLFLISLERSIARRVTDQYYDQSYTVNHLGIGKYDLVNVDHHQDAKDYGFYMNQAKRQKVLDDHGYGYQTILNILLNSSKYDRIGKMRDLLHERRDSEQVTCIDDTIRIESRWCKLYIDKRQEIPIRVVYNLRIHELTKEPIVGIITCFRVSINTLKQNKKLYNSYKNVIQRNRSPITKVILEFLRDGGDTMLYIDTRSNKLINLNENELFSLSEEELSLLSPYNNDIDTIDTYTSAKVRFIDTLKLRPYYAKDDRVNDPDGWLHEDYLLVNFAEEINESNLLKYNHRNVKIYNELLDLKYEEIGGVQNITDNYILNEWEASGPAMFGVAYGYDQSIVYKNLCEAFGKENVDCIWQKYYKFYYDDGLKDA